MKIEIEKDDKLSKLQKDFIVKVVEMRLGELNDDMLLPMSYIHNSKTNAAMIVAHPFDSQESKNMVEAMLKKAIRETGSDSILFSSESWMLSTDAEQTDYKEYQAGMASGKYKNLGDHPKSVDCVMFNFESRFGAWMGCAEIVTIDGERSVESVKFRHSEQSQGRFTNFITPRGV